MLSPCGPFSQHHNSNPDFWKLNTPKALAAVNDTCCQKWALRSILKENDERDRSSGSLFQPGKFTHPHYKRKSVESQEIIPPSISFLTNANERSQEEPPVPQASWPSSLSLSTGIPGRTDSKGNILAHCCGCNWNQPQWGQHKRT